MKRHLAMIVLVAAACADPVSVSTDGGMSAQIDPWGISLRSQEFAPVYYLVMDRESMASTTWMACMSLTCPSVAPGGSKRVTFAEVSGFTAHTKEMMVFWWRLVPAPLSPWPHTGLQPDSMRALVITR